MINTLIGGAISAVFGALSYAAVAWLVELRRGKINQQHIVNDLIVEIRQNLMIQQNPSSQKMWWMVPYKLEAYRAHKGQVVFLPREFCNRLMAIAFHIEGINTAIRVHQLGVAFGQSFPEESIEANEELIQQMEFCVQELQKWQEQDKCVCNIRHR